MTVKQIEQHREKYPLPFNEISLYSSFEQVLGKTRKDFTHEERFKRWDKIMSFDNGMKRYWSECSECHGCEFLDKNNSWCKSQDLPCTVNPILTFRSAMIGLACMGLGYQNKQLQLF